MVLQKMLQLAVARFGTRPDAFDMDALQRAWDEMYPPSLRAMQYATWKPEAIAKRKKAVEALMAKELATLAFYRNQLADIRRAEGMQVKPISGPRYVF